ncbi:MAG: FAD-binding oxidoreductase, partial [Actinobacteria bacterium]|nr:FAD-binding oxidoreductase [Actinomycetota bacterium]
MRRTLDAGGTISHHHGVGRVRAGWIEEELGEWFEVLRLIKKAIDPKGIMNPGVMGL